MLSVFFCFALLPAAENEGKEGCWIVFYFGPEDDLIGPTDDLYWPDGRIRLMTGPTDGSDSSNGRSDWPIGRIILAQWTISFAQRIYQTDPTDLQIGPTDRSDWPNGRSDCPNGRIYLTQRTVKKTFSCHRFVSL